MIATEQVIPLYLDFSENRDVSSSIDRFSSPKIVLGTKTSFDVKITNNGNTYFAPTSYIEFHELGIINSDERTRIETIPVSKGEPILLPESYISGSFDWERGQVGRYEATLHVLYEGVELETQSTNFWIVPKTTFAYAIGGIIGITLIIAGIRSYLKRKTRKSS